MLFMLIIKIKENKDETMYMVHQNMNVYNSFWKTL